MNFAISSFQYLNVHADSPIKKHVKDAVWKRDGGRCVQCGSDHKIHFDHIIPYSWGGADTVENLQILCQRCNLRKGSRHL